MLPGIVFSCHREHGSPVIETAGISGCHSSAIRLECGPEFGEAFESSVGPCMLIPEEHRYSLSARHVHRSELFSEDALCFLRLQHDVDFRKKNNPAVHA